MFWWPLFIAVAAATTLPKCDQLKGHFVLKDDNSNDCTMENRKLGNQDEHVFLDFAQAGQETLDKFLGKSERGNYFEDIYGSVIMIKNHKVQSINLGYIGLLEGKEVPNNGRFIAIYGNSNLKNITGYLLERKQFTIQATRHSDGDGLRILIANNHQLEKASTDLLRNAIQHKTRFNIYIQSGPDDCLLQHPFYTDAYMDGILNDLSPCNSISGDFMMNGGKLGHPIQFDYEPACLYLENVDMTGFQLLNKYDVRNGSRPQGTEKCVNGTTSKIINNKNLCGYEVERVQGYFANPSAVKIQLHESCFLNCASQTELDEKYYMCRTIEVAANIASWFNSAGMDMKRENLISATGLLDMTGILSRTISLPNLTDAYEIKIVSGTMLKEIDLPQLRNIKKLTITGNPKLTKINLENLISIDELYINDNQQLMDINVKNRISLKKLEMKDSLPFEKMKTLPFSIPFDYQSNVHCVLNKSSAVTSFEEMALCTVIHGNLRLRGRNWGRSNASLVQVKELHGCLNVEGTDLWNLDFLLKRSHHTTANNKKTMFHCSNYHHFKNNSHLCPTRYDKGFSDKVKSVGNSIDCDRICDSINNRACSGVDHDLIIDDKVDTSYLRQLKMIRGRLVITGTSFKELEFPQLRIIGSIDTPVLTVSNNPSLTSLRMPHIQEIIARSDGRPIVYLENNTELADLSLFLPSGMECTTSKNGTCYHDGRFPISKITDASWKLWELALLGGCPAVAILLCIVCLVWCLHRREKRKHNLMYIYFKQFRGYELAPLIYERVPFLKTDMKPILNQIICNGLMRYNLIIWRQRFLEQPDERMDYFSARYPYNKMAFYLCTFYLKVPGSFDRFYDKLKTMIVEKKEQLGRKRIYPAKPKRGKYPRKLRTLHILHVGDDWEQRTLTDPESEQRSIEIVRKCGLVYYNKAEMKEVKQKKDLPPRPPKTGSKVVSQLVQVTLKDKQKKEEIEMDRIEMTVIPLPTPMSGQFWDWNFVNWFHLIYLVNRYKGIIHTDNPQYFISINMIMATWNVLLNRNWRHNYDNDNLIEFGEGMYKRYRALYNPESDPIDSWLMWVNAVTSYYVALIPKAASYTEKEAYLFRFDIDLFGRDDPWKMDQRRTERVKQKATVIHWHEEQEIPLDEEQPFTETIKLRLEEPKPDFLWGKEEYFPEKPDDDVEELLGKNPDGGKVKIPKAPKRHSMDIRIKKKQRLDEEEKEKQKEMGRLTSREQQRKTRLEKSRAETEKETTGRESETEKETETGREKTPMRETERARSSQAETAKSLMMEPEKDSSMSK